MASEFHYADGVRLEQVNEAVSDDTGCTRTGTGASTVVFDADAETEYKFFASDSLEKAEGKFALQVIADNPPTNDQCSDAILVVPNGLEMLGSTVNATIDYGFDSCWSRSTLPATRSTDTTSAEAVFGTRLLGLEEG